MCFLLNCTYRRSCMNWYILALSKYFVLKGRSRRMEFWYFALFNLIIALLLTCLDYTIGTFDPASAIGLFSGIYSMFIFIPSLTVQVRRLHDVGLSGWMILLNIIPLVGALILLYFYVQPSQSGKNSYGTNPIKAKDLEF